MNMYSNPRLKHVKKIVDICAKMFPENPFKQPIFDQCNLLLETKKAKKRKRRHWFKPDVFGDMRCRFCRKHFSQKIEGEWVKRFEEELVEMSLFKGRDMHNRPPLYDMTNDKVEEIKSFISDLLASERQEATINAIRNIAKWEGQWSADKDFVGTFGEWVIKNILNTKSL